MGTARYMSWAFDLEKISSEAKLLAIYIAGTAGMDEYGEKGLYRLDLDAARRFCCHDKSEFYFMAMLQEIGFRPRTVQDNEIILKWEHVL